MDYFKKRKPKLLERPAHSPDLNIIENRWVGHKHAVCARQPNIISEL